MKDDVGTTAGDIDLLDVEAADTEVTVEAITTGEGSLLRWWPLAVVVLLGTWLVTTSGSPDESVAAPDLTPSSTIAPVSPMLRSQLDFDLRDVDVATPGQADQSDPWPSPPLDRDPYVVRIPGPDTLPFDPDVGTLVYINSVGDPTVVSLATGDVFEVDVAAIRVHETFAVEDGEVRSLEGANRALADATEHSVVFHTYRDVDPPGVGSIGDRRGIGRGPELCLSASSCARPGQGLDRVELGGVVTERLDRQRHAAVVSILDSWEEVDRWIVGPTGYRIPTPMDQIWIMTPA